MSEQNSQNKDKVRIDFPPKWVTTEKANGEPYTISNGKGESWPAVKCTLPSGTKVDGKDLSGFNFTTFQKPWNKADIEAGKGHGRLRQRRPQCQPLQVRPGRTAPR